MKMLNLQSDDRQQIVAEILELGQALFDTVIEEASAGNKGLGQEREDFAVSEAESAAETFFDNLRRLFGLSDDRPEIL